MANVCVHTFPSDGGWIPGYVDNYAEEIGAGRGKEVSSYTGLHVPKLNDSMSDQTCCQLNASLLPYRVLECYEYFMVVVNFLNVKLNNF